MIKGSLTNLCIWVLMLALAAGTGPGLRVDALLVETAGKECPAGEEEVESKVFGALAAASRSHSSKSSRASVARRAIPLKHRRRSYGWFAASSAPPPASPVGLRCLPLLC